MKRIETFLFWEVFEMSAKKFFVGTYIAVVFLQTKGSFRNCIPAFWLRSFYPGDPTKSLLCILHINCTKLVWITTKFFLNLRGPAELQKTWNCPMSWKTWDSGKQKIQWSTWQYVCWFRMDYDVIQHKWYWTNYFYPLFQAIRQKLEPARISFMLWLQRWQ